MGSSLEYVEFSTLFLEKPRNGLYKSKGFQGRGNRWIKMGEVYKNDFFSKQETELLEVSESEIERFACESGDLLFGRTSLILEGIGDCLLIGEIQDKPIFESNLFRIRLDKSKAKPLFYFYFFKSVYGKQLLQKIAKQTAATSITSTDLSNEFVPYFPIEVQEKIANQIYRYDEKIKLNRQMNKTLESMAQTLFKSWFVDFDPVIDNALAAGNDIPDAFTARAALRKNAKQPKKGEVDANDEINPLFPSEFEYTEAMGWIPKGWSADKLGNFVDVKRGGSPRPIHDFLAPSGLPWVKISDATASNSRFLVETKQFIKPEGLKKTTLLKKGTLILSNSATPGLPKYLDLDACIHDGWLHFPVKQTLTDKYLYQLFLVIRKELLMQGNGSVFTNLKTDILKNHNLIVPNNEILEFFEERMESIHKKIHNIQLENNTLEKLRDTLLPKLISGELRIPDVEKMIEEATGHD